MVSLEVPKLRCIFLLRLRIGIEHVTPTRNSCGLRTIITHYLAYPCLRLTPCGQVSDDGGYFLLGYDSETIVWTTGRNNDRGQFRQ